jgi:hypothetical protein
MLFVSLEDRHTPNCTRACFRPLLAGMTVSERNSDCPWPGSDDAASERR